MTRNRKIHDWSKQLVHGLRRVGIRATEPVLNRSRKGYYSAYFGVPGLGEIRVSDHPLERSPSTADISISSPSSYADLVKAFVCKYNLVLGVRLTAVDMAPFVIDTAQDAELLREIEQKLSRKEAERLARQEEVAARVAWWLERISESGLRGTQKEIKMQLKRQGVRYPADGEGQG